MTLLYFRVLSFRFLPLLSFYLLELADDEDEYEEAEGGNRLLGFMFGNVDGAGDLDVDYLDQVMCFLRSPQSYV